MPTGFLLERTRNTKPNSAAPAVALSAKTKPLSDALINQQIYVTVDDHFPCSFRDIFKHTQVTHYSGKESCLVIKFSIKKIIDFRFKGGKNRGFGAVYIWDSRSNFYRL